MLFSDTNELTMRNSALMSSEKNAAPQGRIKIEWIAELCIHRLFVIMINSKVEELIAGPYSPVPA